MFGAASYVYNTATTLVYGPPPPPSPPAASASPPSTVSSSKPARPKKPGHPRHSSSASLPSSKHPRSRLRVPPPASMPPNQSRQPQRTATYQRPTRSQSPLPPSQEAHPPADRARAHEMVDQINNHVDLYNILGLTSSSRHQIHLEDIRRAYITRSRLCHPDKLPQYEPCTAAFQKLSFAYETLSKPSTRRLYDLGGHRQQVGADDLPPRRRPGATHFQSTPPAATHESFRAFRSAEQPVGGSPHGINGDETLNGVLYSTFCEFMDGDFEMIRVLINALNEGNPGLNLGEEAVVNLESTFKRIRTVLLAGQKYFKVVRFELMKLYEIQCSLRRLSYFNLVGRVRLSLALARVTISIPMRIDQAMRSGEEEDDDDEEEGGGRRRRTRGILPRRVAGLLEATVAALERGERATMWASPSTDVDDATAQRPKTSSDTDVKQSTPPCPEHQSPLTDTINLQSTKSKHFNDPSFASDRKDKENSL